MGWSHIYIEKEETYYGDCRVNFVQYKMVWLGRICGNSLVGIWTIAYLFTTFQIWGGNIVCMWSILTNKSLCVEYINPLNMSICRYAIPISMIYSSKNYWRTQLSDCIFSEFRESVWWKQIWKSHHGDAQGCCLLPSWSSCSLNEINTLWTFPEDILKK